MATTTTKKTASRPRPARKKPVEDIPMPEIEVLELNSEDMDDEPDLVEIFKLDGKPYYIDRNVGVGVTLRMLRALKNQGEMAATVDVLVELLGEEGFDALSNFRGIRDKHLAQVLVSCQKAIFGDKEKGPKA